MYLASRREFDAGESPVLVQLEAWDRYARRVDVVDPVSPTPPISIASTAGSCSARANSVSMQLRVAPVSISASAV